MSFSDDIHVDTQAGVELWLRPQPSPAQGWMKALVVFKMNPESQLTFFHNAVETDDDGDLRFLNSVVPPILEGDLLQLRISHPFFEEQGVSPRPYPAKKQHEQDATLFPTLGVQDIGNLDSMLLIGEAESGNLAIDGLNHVDHLEEHYQQEVESPLAGTLADLGSIGWFDESSGESVPGAVWALNTDEFEFAQLVYPISVDGRPPEARLTIAVGGFQTPNMWNSFSLPLPVPEPANAMSLVAFALFSYSRLRTKQIVI